MHVFCCFFLMSKRPNCNRYDTILCALFISSPNDMSIHTEHVSFAYAYFAYLIKTKLQGKRIELDVQMDGGFGKNTVI